MALTGVEPMQASGSETRRVDKELLQISFLSLDAGLGEAIARALGDGFTLRTNGTTRVDQLQELLRWSDVVLLDLRHSTEQTEEIGLRILDDINAQPAHPPVLVLCDAEDQIGRASCRERVQT